MPSDRATLCKKTPARFSKTFNDGDTVYRVVKTCRSKDHVPNPSKRQLWKAHLDKAIHELCNDETFKVTNKSLHPKDVVRIYNFMEHFFINLLKNKRKIRNPATFLAQQVDAQGLEYVVGPAFLCMVLRIALAAVSY